VGKLKLAVIGAGGVGQVIVDHLVKAGEAKVRVGDVDRSRLREAAKQETSRHQDWMRAILTRLGGSSGDRMSSSTHLIRSSTC
jgi:saccharopine dehydrogenase-like NADP-dependent oxidoreductase